MARTRTSGGDERFFEFLRTLHQGQVVSEEDILTATGWSVSTLKTYRSKRKFGRFLTYDRVSRSYRVLQEGTGCTYSQFAENFTQVNAEEHIPVRGVVLAGEIRPYTLIEEVGAGAVAKVWKCQYTSGNGRELAAAKMMAPRSEFLEPSKMADIAKRFRKESGNGSRFAHSNIVRIIDKGEFGEKPFVIMELADCSTRKLISGRQKVELKTSLQIVNATAKALETLHAHACVHRDIKPDNILMFGDRYVLGDLGVVLWDYLNLSYTRAGSLTRDSVILGSLHYMAPEQQRRAREATAASDIYSLGMTWIELLTGDLPGPADIAMGHYPPPSGDDDINAYIRRMVSYLPNARPTACDVVAFTQGHFEG